MTPREDRVKIAKAFFYFFELDRCSKLDQIVISNKTNDKSTYKTISVGDFLDFLLKTLKEDIPEPVKPEPQTESENVLENK